MNKIIMLLIFIGAFFVSLFYIITKKKITLSSSQNSSFLRRKFVTAIMVFITLFSNAKIMANQDKSEAKEAPKAIKTARYLQDITLTDEWQQLKKIWHEFRESKEFWKDPVSFEDQRRTAHANYLRHLAAKGYFSPEVADMISFIYDDLLISRIQPSIILNSVTCYKMDPLTPLDQDYYKAVDGIQADLYNRLIILSGYDRKGVIEENVLNEAKNNIAMDIEYWRKIKALYDKVYDIDYKFSQEEKETFAHLLIIQHLL